MRGRAPERRDREGDGMMAIVRVVASHVLGSARLGLVADGEITLLLKRLR